MALNSYQGFSLATRLEYCMIVPRRFVRILVMTVIDALPNLAHS